MKKQMAQTIVLVDDETFFLRLYHAKLKSLKCGILTFSNPQEFISYLQTHPDFTPDLVVTDSQMPIMTGTQMIETALVLRDNFPSLLLSAYVDKNVAIEATNRGIWNILEKPVETEVFLATARKLLMESRLKRIRKEIEAVTLKISEMFLAFRILCMDQLELDVMHKPVLLNSPRDSQKRAISLETAMSDLQKDLKRLTDSLQEEEKEVSVQAV